MPAADLLTDTEIDQRLTALPGWSRDGDTLRRTVRAEDFPTAIRIVTAVAEQAEQMDHHPDIDIRWRTLHFTLSTHSAGGITALDFELAARIDQVAAAH
ncbi:4a-hydroxytetrahydrobiopterin dehydratase [Peterkaempfera griseoplana]|uniref:4a-hydroxytetrahydrobiopterin dehydratase n=1 Tax=Peterkaempfera griseoplana TaxID=66896 RepID=UPI0006E35D4D|nr:4a-hydroxytetrahydrobiopterin dehydratase [Peterkaempfera griseoplana]